MCRVIHQPEGFPDNASGRLNARAGLHLHRDVDYCLDLAEQAEQSARELGDPANPARALLLQGSCSESPT